MKATSIALLTMSAVAAAGGQILFKLGADGRHHLIDFINTSIASGLLLYGIGTAIWVYVLSTEALVNVFAFTSLTFVLVFVGNVLIEGANPSRAGILGIILVLSGLYLIPRHSP
jgi:undecaprenyl phosphate-alpha-L-ara4N flippase subunit ArnE